jgi:hypothetical protein
VGPDFTPNWGIQNGLTVVIDTVSDWYPASVRQDFLGVQVPEVNITYLHWWRGLVVPSGAMDREIK